MMLRPCLYSSGLISSTLGALLFFRALIAGWISSADISSILIISFSHLATAVLRSYVVAGSGWLSTSLKCSAHLSFCASSSLRSILQSLSCLGTFAIFCLPLYVSRFYIVFSVFETSCYPSLHYPIFDPLPFVISAASSYSFVEISVLIIAQCQLLRGCIFHLDLCIPPTIDKVPGFQ